MTEPVYIYIKPDRHGKLTEFGCPQTTSRHLGTYPLINSPKRGVVGLDPTDAKTRRVETG